MVETLGADPLEGQGLPGRQVGHRAPRRRSGSRKAERSPASRSASAAVAVTTRKGRLSLSLARPASTKGWAAPATARVASAAPDDAGEGGLAADERGRARSGAGGPVAGTARSPVTDGSPSAATGTVVAVHGLVDAGGDDRLHRVGRLGHADVEQGAILA